MRTFFCTSFARSSFKVIMCNRDQVLRFDITVTTTYPSCVNLECQTSSLVCSPHANIVYICIHQTTFTVVFVHQIFFTNIFEESQAITTVSYAFVQIYIVETTIQRSVIRIDCKCRGSCFTQRLNFYCCIQDIICYTSFNSTDSCIVCLYDSIETFAFIMIVFFEEETVSRSTEVFGHCIFSFSSFTHECIFQLNRIRNSIKFFDTSSVQLSSSSVITKLSPFLFNQAEGILTIHHIQQRVFTITLSQILAVFASCIWVQIFECIFIQEELGIRNIFVT